MNRTVLMITVIAAAVMELIDTSIVNVIVIPSTSFLAGTLGRRNYYIGSVILFTVCSLLCGQATNIWMLVAFRFLQGMGGGALLSVSAASALFALQMPICCWAFVSLSV